MEIALSAPWWRNILTYRIIVLVQNEHYSKFINMGDGSIHYMCDSFAYRYVSIERVVRCEIVTVWRGQVWRSWCRSSSRRRRSGMRAPPASTTPHVSVQSVSPHAGDSYIIGSYHIIQIFAIDNHLFLLNWFWTLRFGFIDYNYYWFHCMNNENFIGIHFLSIIYAICQIRLACFFWTDIAIWPVKPKGFDRLS